MECTNRKPALLGERTIRTQPDMMKEGTISYRFSDKTLLDEEGRGARVVIGDSRRVFMG